MKIRLIQLMYKKRPNLIGELKYNIELANNSDYYIPSNLKNYCYKIKIEIPKKLCEMLSCNPARMKGMCTQDSNAEIYRLGDTENWDINCQPACFNTTIKGTFNESGIRAPDTPMLNFHNNECRILNSPIITYLEKTYFRSDIIYEARKNDMPTGFTRYKTNNIYGSGFQYKSNPTYCKYYDRTMNDDGSCVMQWWETALDSVIGMSLINTTKSAIRSMINNNNVPFTEPDNLPKLPTDIPKIYTVKGWFDHRNENFILPTLIKYPTNYAITRRKRDTSHQINDKNKETNISKLLNTLESTMSGLLEAFFTDPKFLASIGINILTDVSVNSFKEMCKRLVDTLGRHSIEELLKISGTISVKVLSSTLKGVSIQFIAMNTLRYVSQITIQLAKIAAAASSVVGWVLLIFMFADLLFTFWDPYGYSEMFPANLPKDIMTAGERSLIQTFNTTSIDFNFNNLIQLILSEQEIMEIQITSMHDRIVYLNSLVVNSEGTKIIKDETINLSDLNKSEVTSSVNKSLVSRVKFNEREYENYNRLFLNRVKLNNILNNIAISLVGLSFILFILNLQILFVVILIISIIIFSFSLYQLVETNLIGISSFRDNILI